MRSHYRMANRVLVEEAMSSLAALGCLAAMARGDDHLLIVNHDDDLETEVKRVVESVDPSAVRVHQPRGA